MKVRIKHLCGYRLVSDVDDVVHSRVCEYAPGAELYVNDYDNHWRWLFFPTIAYELYVDPVDTDQHYNNEKGSLYLFAKQHDLNAWEFDIIKRISRCRKKCQFKEDLEKTKRVIDLYLKEFEL